MVRKQKFLLTQKVKQQGRTWVPVMPKKKNGKRGILFSVFLLLASCAAENEIPARYQPYFDENNPSTMVDVYVASQGMIEGIILSGRLNALNALALLKQDKLTRDAVLRQGLMPSDENRENATLQLQNLLGVINQIESSTEHSSYSPNLPAVTPVPPAVPHGKQGRS